MSLSPWPMLSVLLAVLAVAGTARGQAAAADAERLRAAALEFDAGRRAFKAGDFDSAAAHFENADRDAPTPEALRSAIRSRAAARQDARAATLASAALSRYPRDAATVELAAPVLRAANAKLHRARVACSPACLLVLDGKVMPWGETTLADIFLDSGPHALVAAWSGDRSVEQTIDARPGGSVSLELRAPPEPSQAQAPTSGPGPLAPELGTPTASAPLAVDEGSGLPKPVFFTALGVSAVMVGVTVWSGVDMTSDPGRDKVRTDCARQDESCPTYQHALAQQRRTTILMGVTGGTLAVTALVGLFLTRWGGDDSNQASLVPVATVGDGFTLGAAGRF